MDVVDVLEVSISMVLFSLHICENLSYIYACLYMYVVSYLGLENTYRTNNKLSSSSQDSSLFIN